MPFRVARNFNEGWNAYWALTASTGGLLYPPMDALISNTYPPVSFLVLGFLGRTPADPILVGRVVALISLLVVTVNIGIWLRLNGTRFSVAVLSSVAFIVTMDMLGPGYIAKNDPQWFAHALITTAMVILWRDPRSSTRVVSAATLVLLGGWAKHLLIALPTALSVWLFQVNRRAFWRWLALLGALSALFAAIALSHYGHDLISGVLWTPRRVSVKRVFMVATTVLPPLIPSLCFALALIARYRSCAASRFIINYLIIAGAVAILASAGDGVWVNAAFDAAIAGALATGMALEELAALPTIRGSRPVLIGATVVAAMIFVSSVPAAVASNLARLRALPGKIDATTADIEFIRQHGARTAACEALALCFWAGAPFNLDFFNFGQKLKTARLPMTLCLQLFDGTRYSVVHLYSAPPDPDPVLPRACSGAIAQHYRVARSSSNGSFLVPRVPELEPAR